MSVEEENQIFEKLGHIMWLLKILAGVGTVFAASAAGLLWFFLSTGISDHFALIKTKEDVDWMKPRVTAIFYGSKSTKGDTE